MEDICRLCCSTTFVNNHIFDDENALYIKMSLYLPIKVFKNDNLPQKICDKCSCKVNDIYQFCNETIEVQHRLRKALLSSNYVDDTFDLTRVKHNASPLPTALGTCEQSTQTEVPQLLSPTYNVQVKVEPKSTSPIKIEDDSTTGFDDRSSDEDITLIQLKTSKNNSKLQNGKVPKKRGRKKKVNNMDGWKMLMNALPEGALSVVDKGALAEVSEVSLDVVKEEVGLRPGRKEGEDELYHCCVCLVQCYGRREMLKHYRQHAAEISNVEPPMPPPPPEPLRCNRCRKAVSESEWASHWTRHWARDRRPYRCSTCAKTFRDPSQIFKHGLTHNYTEESTLEPVEKRFVCDLCPEGFVYMRYLLAHRARAHPEASARALELRCAVCSRVFAHINSLHRHLRAHSGERNFLCNVCGKALSSREHLKFHIRIHTGYKPNVCKTCGKGFVKKCNLTLHERVHSGEKPHVCSHCGKAFSQRSTLVIHERYHSGARPYVCGLCGRGFVAKGLLSMHLKTTCI